MCMILYQGQSYSAAHRAIRSLVRFFFASDLVFFFGNWEKRRILWIGNGAYYLPLVIGRKGPVHIFGNHTFILEQAQ